MNPAEPPNDPTYKTTFHAPPGRPAKWRSTPREISKVDYKPSARQAVFHSCPADVVLYGGAAGGGKSMALLMDAYAHCREASGRHALLMRRTYPELEGSLILDSQKLFPKAICQYNEVKRRWVIQAKNGGESVLEFGFCKLEKDKFKYQSRQFTYIGFDESTHFPWSIFSYLMSRARTARAGNKVYIRLASNPGNIGHAWHKRYFGLAKNSGVVSERVWTPEPNEDDLDPLPRCYIPARVFDNVHLMTADPSYVKRLMLLPPVTRKRLLEGDWEDVEGKYFTDFSKHRHVVPAFDIPKFWKVYRSVDYGFTKPFCCTWYALAPDGHCYCFRELYQSGLRDIEQALLIKKVSKESVEYTVGDPSMRHKNSSGKSAAENYNTAADIALVPADNNRVAGWMSVRNWLAPLADGKPGLVFFDTCINTIREMEDAIHDEENPDDVNTDISDHAIDTVRYFASSHPQLPDVPANDPYRHLDEASRREWERHEREIKRLAGQNQDAVLHGLHEDDGMST